MNQKQQAAFDKLVAAVTGVTFGVDAQADGTVLLTAPSWPVVKIGKGGGFDMPEIKSFEESAATGGRFGAILRGPELEAKRLGRLAKAAKPAAQVVDPMVAAVEEMEKEKAAAEAAAVATMEGEGGAQAA